MSVDFVSSLNQDGSKVNLTSIASDLTNAQIAPKRDALNTRIEQSNTSISALGSLKSNFQSLVATFEAAQGISAYSINSASSAFSAQITEPAIVAPRNDDIEVLQIAQSQVIEFSGFSSPDDVLDAGELTIQFGSYMPRSDGTDIVDFTENPYKPQNALTIAEGTTIGEFLSDLRLIEGVRADLIDVGDGTLTLSVVSESGNKNALRITDSTAPGEGTTGNIALSQFELNEANLTAQTREARNAELTLNGIKVERTSNTFDDLLDGVTLTLKTPSITGTDQLTVSPDAETAYGALNIVVAAVNELRSNIDRMTSQGFVVGVERGELAGNTIAQGLTRRLSNSVGAEILGFDDDGFHLSDLGVQTNRDGSLSIDRKDFENGFGRDPKMLERIFNDKMFSEDRTTRVSGQPKEPQPGKYEFTRDPETNEAQFDGQSVRLLSEENGRLSYYVGTGNFAGTVIEISDTETETTIRFGESLASTVGREIDRIAGKDGVLSRQETYYGRIVSRDETSLADLVTEEDRVLSSYKDQFAAMEAAITQLNRTGAALSNIIDSMKPSD